MTTPQDPQNPDGTPQDPQDPVNPYGEPPAAQPTPPEQPKQPQYGQPQQAQPPYGAPPQYGQPQYGQPGQYGAPAYGQPAYPMQSGPTQPSKAMAIVALVLALLICIPIVPALVAIALGIVVLRRGKDGREHGRGLAISAIIISVLALLAWTAGFIVATQVDWDELLPIENLETGECLNASNLTDDSEEFVEDIDVVPCTSPHDAEVLAVKDLTADEAENYADTDLCTPLLESAGALEKLTPGSHDYTGLTSISEPNAGDKLVCIAYRIDGSKLDAPL